MTFSRVASSVVEHPAFNRLVLSSNLRRPILLYKFSNISIYLTNLFRKLSLLLLFCFITLFFGTSKAGINKFSKLIFVGDWLIERKILLSTEEVKCRASLPKGSMWFGDRIRLGSNDELIKPQGNSSKEEELSELWLNKLKRYLKDCRAGLIFIQEN